MTEADLDEAPITCGTCGSPLVFDVVDLVAGSNEEIRQGNAGKVMVSETCENPDCETKKPASE
jgi:hypothetical protein